MEKEWEVKWSSIKAYKISVYHPCINPAERVLQEVGPKNILLSASSEVKCIFSTSTILLNVFYHKIDRDDTISINTPSITGTPPSCEIMTIIKFSRDHAEELDITKYYNRSEEKLKTRMTKVPNKPIRYWVGEKVLLRNW